MRKVVIPITDTLKIQTWLKIDSEELFLLVDENRDILKEWLIWVPQIKTKKDIDIFIAKCQKEYEQKTRFQMGLWDGKKLIGTIGIGNLDIASKKASIGYWLSEDYQGKGIMTMATKAVLNYAFETLDLNRVELKIASKNSKSTSIAERLGFIKEGTLRQDEILNGEYHDYNIYSFLKSDWNELS